MSERCEHHPAKPCRDFKHADASTLDPACYPIPQHDHG